MASMPPPPPGRPPGPPSGPPPNMPPYGVPYGANPRDYWRYQKEQNKAAWRAQRQHKLSGRHGHGWGGSEARPLARRQPAGMALFRPGLRAARRRDQAGPGHHRRFG